MITLLLCWLRTGHHPRRIRGSFSDEFTTWNVYRCDNCGHVWDDYQITAKPSTAKH